MKAIVFSVSLLFGIIVFNISCTKNEEISKDIIYPDSGYFGENVLRESQINIILRDEAELFNYSVRAELPENSSLKVVVRNVVHPNWAMSGTTTNGWVRKVENPLDSIFVLVLYASGPEVCDGGVIFDRNGSNTIEFYENNSSEPVRVKTITY